MKNCNLRELLTHLTLKKILGLLILLAFSWPNPVKEQSEEAAWNSLERNWLLVALVIYLKQSLDGEKLRIYRHCVLLSTLMSLRLLRPYKYLCRLEDYFRVRKWHEGNLAFDNTYSNLTEFRFLIYIIV